MFGKHRIAQGLLVVLLFATLAMGDERATQQKVPPPLHNVTFRLVIQLGHTAPITAVVLSPNGKYLLSGGMDKTARLWHVESGKELHFFPHSSWVTSVAFSPDGKLLLTGNLGDAVFLWDANTAQPLGRFKHAMTTSVAFAPDGTHVLTAGWGGQVRLWDIKTKLEVRRFEGLEAGIASVVHSAAFSPDGKYVVAGSNTALIWDAHTAKQIATLGSHDNAINSVAFSPNSQKVLTGSADATARLWDGATGKEIQCFRGHSKRVLAVAFAPNGERIVTGSQDQTVRIWDANTGKELDYLKGTSQASETVSFHPDGRHILTVDQTNSIRLVNWETGKAASRFGVQSSWVTSIRASSGGSDLLVGCWDGTAKLWNLAEGAESLRVQGHSAAVDTVTFLSPATDFFTGSRDDTGQLWSATGNKDRSFQGSADGKHLLFLPSRPVAISPTGKYVVTTMADHSACLWATATGAELRRFKGHTDRIVCVEFSPNGAELLTLSLDGTARLWDVETGKEIDHLNGVASIISSAAAFSPVGGVIALGSGTEVWIWERAPTKKTRRLNVSSSQVSALAFSNDGTRILIGSIGKTAYLWDTATGREILRLEGHADAVTGAAFLPGALRALTASQDQTIRVWDIGPKQAERSKGEERCQLFSFREGWGVIDPEGRFDTNNLDEIEGVHWVASDDPLHPLSPNIFMRDYYEPRLLSRLLAGESFRPIRSLAGLNRAQPGVRVVKVKVGSRPGTAEVVVEVDPVEGKVVRGDKTLPSRSVHDLRLFRDGQLVAQEPSPNLDHPSPEGTTDADVDAWGAATLVRAGGRVIADKKTGRMSVRFEGVQLPTRPGEKIEFSAYAFNADRVKSEVGSREWKEPKDLPVRQPRAYLLCVGVSDYGNAAFNLEYAADDAHTMAKALSADGRLPGYQVVPPVVLAVDKYRPSNTKEALKAALELLAGPKAGDETGWQDKAKALHARVPGGASLAPATPDDLVLVSFSGHGYTDDRNEFFLILPEAGPLLHKGERPSTEALKNCVSGEELSQWLRRVDAGEMALVVDACHSAATVEQPWFKPGPMGSRGLGQLAYDKRMRVLAASQADDFALESKNLRHGLLTYALVMDGLEKDKADFRPKDGRMTLGEWLGYGAARVPELHRRLRAGLPLEDSVPGDSSAKAAVKGVIVKRDKEVPKVIEATEELIRLSTLANKRAFQTPALFDYARGRTDPTLTTLPIK